MTAPILPLVHAITDDRIREADTARLARAITPEPAQPQRRRIRALATRLAFTAK